MKTILIHLNQNYLIVLQRIIDLKLDIQKGIQVFIMNLYTKNMRKLNDQAQVLQKQKELLMLEVMSNNQIL